MHALHSFPVLVLLIFFRYSAVTITAHKPIYGLIVVQDPDKIYGTFPYINKRHHTTLPSGLARGFCENTPVEGQNLHNVFENIPSVTHK